MIEDDFFNLEEEENINLIEECEKAFNDGSLSEKLYSEEEFEILILHYLHEMDDELLGLLTTMGVRQHPYSIDLALRQADFFLMTGELEKSLNILNYHLALNPSSSDILFLFARLNVKLEKDSEVNSCLEKALSLTDEELHFDMIISIAQDYIEVQNFKKSIEILKMAEELEPDNPELLNDLAFSYERIGEYDLGMKYYQRFLDKDPFNDNVWFNVGTIYARLLDIPNALDAFDNAHALNPYNSSVLYNKAVLLVKTNRVDDAILTFEEFLKLEPYNNIARNALAEAYLVQENFIMAEKTYLETLNYDPTDMVALTNLVIIYISRDDFYLSLIYLRRLIVEGSQPDFSTISDSLLECYKKSENVEFLLYYLVSLYHLKSVELFEIYLKILIEIDELWLAKLYEIIPSLKRDKEVTLQIKKIRKNSY